jgi:hypothetical protein
MAVLFDDPPDVSDPELPVAGAVAAVVVAVCVTPMTVTVVG